MNPLAFIGYLVFAGAGLLIYVGLWVADATRPFMIFMHVLAGGILVLLVVWLLLTERRGDAKTPSAKEDKREGTPRSSSVPSGLKEVDVVVEEWEPYPLSDRRGTPNFRVRVAVTNNTEQETTLETWHFVVVDREGEDYFDLGWLADLPDRLPADGSTTLQSGESAHGWLYFEVHDPGRVARLEFDQLDLSSETKTIRLNRSAARRR